VIKANPAKHPPKPRGPRQASSAVQNDLRLVVNASALKSCGDTIRAAQRHSIGTVILGEIGLKIEYSGTGNVANLVLASTIEDTIGSLSAFFELQDS
jgi:hypothetical protein